MTPIERIQLKLEKAFLPSKLVIEDESAAHAGHMEIDENMSQTHIHITICADALTQISRVRAHQKIYAELKEEMDNGLHAIRISIL